ncbi:MAG: DUF4230 domain-containing protein [Eubacterium sp.]|nr:DUF4230 domain-containing protein [Eubacterium sp.]
MRDRDDLIIKYEKRKTLRTIIILLIVMIMVAAVCFTTIFAVKKLTDKKQPTITSASLYSKIEESSELTSAKMYYNGVLFYSEGDIPYLTQMSYNMTYSAEVRAGIDVSEIEIKVEDDRVVVDLPEPEIQDINIDPDSVKFFDKKNALFNWEKMEDGVDAIKYAKDDVEANANLEVLKEEALENSRTLIQGLLEDSVGDKELYVH